MIAGLCLSACLAAACRDAGGDRSKRAADEIVDQRGEGAPIAHDAAEAELAALRGAIVERYRAQHRVFTLQAETARGVLSDPALGLEAAQVANDLLVVMQRELDKAGQAIDSLALVVAEQWATSYTTAQTAMMQLEGAHHDAWNALAVERGPGPPS